MEIFVLLGIRGSGRRKILFNLLNASFGEGDSVLICASKGEGADDFFKKTCELPFVCLRDFDEGDFSGMEQFDAVFIVMPGEAHLLEWMESFSQKLLGRKMLPTRIVGVVDCELFSKHKALRPYYDALFHFSDVFLLNKVEKAHSDWLKEYRTFLKKACYPCLIEEVKNGQAKNPPIILDSTTRRMSHIFDAIDPIDSMEFDEDNLPDEPFDIESQPDPFFKKREDGSYLHTLPDLNEFFEK